MQVKTFLESTIETALSPSYLALHTYTPAEWEARGGQSLTSPDCLGGSKYNK